MFTFQITCRTFMGILNRPKWVSNLFFSFKSIFSLQANCWGLKTHPFNATISAQIFLVRFLSYSFETEIEITISASSFFSNGIVIGTYTCIQVCYINSYEISTLSHSLHICIFIWFGILCKLVVSFYSFFFFMWINSNCTKCFLVWAILWNCCELLHSL